MRVLIVEDEGRLAQNVAALLREQIYCAVDVSNDDKDGLHMTLTNPYDLIVLELLLSKVCGVIFPCLASM